MTKIDTQVNYKMKWYRQLWRWLFPPKPVEFKEVKRITARLLKKAVPMDKLIITTMGTFKIRKNGRLLLQIGRGKNKETVRCQRI